MFAGYRLPEKVKLAGVVNVVRQPPQRMSVQRGKRVQTPVQSQTNAKVRAHA